jgi:biotin carboxyl carrier protein
LKKYYVQTDDGLIELEFEEKGDHLLVRMGDQELTVDLRKVSDPSLFSLIIDNQSHEVFVDRHGDAYDVLVEGELHRMHVQDEWARRLASIQRRSKHVEGDLIVKAPMPGIVLRVEVSPGDTVERGQGLVVLGAMKMENQIKAPRGGVVKEVSVEAGQTVEQGRALVIIE